MEGKRTPFKSINSQPLGLGIIAKEPPQHHQHQQQYHQQFKPNFPSSFNPKRDPNMNHQEKVDKWIIQVPTYPSSNIKDIWDNSCYNPLIALSNEYKNEEDMGPDIDLSNYRDIIEFQSRTITFLSNQLYFNDKEKVKVGRDGNEENWGF